MAALPYSTRFLSWLNEIPVTTFEVPTGYVAIVRDVDVSTGGGSVLNWWWGVNGLQRLGGGEFEELEVAQYQTWRGRQVVMPGEYIYATSDGACSGAISGYLLVDLSS